MPRPVPVRPLLAGLVTLAFMVTAAPSCGPDPIGVEDCRQIEQARCEAGAKCGVVPDVTACRRFYRDHCLHGFALKEAPQTRVITSCVEAIRALGQCATTGSDAPVSSCDAVQPFAAPITVCDAIAAPEEIPACRFLIAQEPETPDASGGSGGAAPDGSGGAAPDGSDDAASGGSSGASGAADSAPE